MSVIPTTSSSVYNARLGHTPETLGRSLNRLAAGLKAEPGRPEHHGRMRRGEERGPVRTGEQAPLEQQIEASNAGAMLPPIENGEVAAQVTEAAGAMLNEPAAALRAFSNLTPGAALRLLNS